MQRQPGYVIFIDEAGDPGIRTVAPAVPGGASEWFTMGAMVIKQDRDAETVAWVREIKDAVHQHQRPYFHYKDVGAGERRRLCCELLASKPCRLFAIASHKPNMSGYSNPRPEGRNGQFTFYNWVLRVLLERVTHWIRERSIEDHGEILPARLVLSATGGLRYSQMKAYHELLRLQGQNAYLNTRTIAWDVLHPSLYEPVPAKTNAGVQLADIVASAVYQAVHVDGANWDLQPALALAPKLARRRDVIENCGLTLMPLKKADRNLDANRRQLFEEFGFVL